MPFVLDMGNQKDHQRWLAELSRAAGPEALSSFSNSHRNYTFTVSLEGEKLAQFTIRHSAARDVHAQLCKHVEVYHKCRLSTTSSGLWGLGCRSSAISKNGLTCVPRKKRAEHRSAARLARPRAAHALGEG